MCKSAATLGPLLSSGIRFDRLHFILVNSNAFQSLWQKPFWNYGDSYISTENKNRLPIAINVCTLHSDHAHLLRVYQSALEHLHFNKNAFVIMCNFVFIARFSYRLRPLFPFEISASILMYSVSSAQHTLSSCIIKD